MINKSPDGPATTEDGLNKITYTWAGLFRKYRVKAYYNADKEPHLIRYTSE
jgi:hypothetical protein